MKPLSNPYIPKYCLVLLARNVGVNSFTTLFRFVKGVPVISVAQVWVFFSCGLAVSGCGRVTLVSDFCSSSRQTPLIHSRTWWEGTQTRSVQSCFFSQLGKQPSAEWAVEMIPFEPALAEIHRIYGTLIRTGLILSWASFDSVTCHFLFWEDSFHLWHFLVCVCLHWWMFLLGKKNPKQPGCRPLMSSHNIFWSVYCTNHFNGTQ